MTFIMVRVGEDVQLLANADCGVRVLMDWLLLRASELLQEPIDGQLDMCDERGALRLLWWLPPTVHALEVLTPRSCYHLVVRPPPPAPAAEQTFRLVRPLARREATRELQQRIRRALTAWEKLVSRTPRDLTAEEMVELVQKSLQKQTSSRPARSGGRSAGRGHQSPLRSRQRSSDTDTSSRSYNTAASRSRLAAAHTTHVHKSHVASKPKQAIPV